MQCRILVPTNESPQCKGSHSFATTIRDSALDILKRSAYLEEYLWPAVAWWNPLDLPPFYRLRDRGGTWYKEIPPAS
jgi:hypothetical protein